MDVTSEYKLGYNVILLLLQITLERQYEICTQGLAQDGDDQALFQNPIVDEVIHNEFIHHKMMKTYKLDGSVKDPAERERNWRNGITRVTLTDIRNIIKILYNKGIWADGVKSTSEELSLVTLCEFYYGLRIEQLKSELLPCLQKDLQNTGVF